MTREEFEILVNEYGVPMEAAERFTPEDDGVDYKALYEQEHADFEAAKSAYLDKVFEKKEEIKEEKDDKKEEIEIGSIETVEREV